MDWCKKDGTFEYGERFEEEGMQQVELGADEGRGVAVAGPSRYGDHVEGLVE